MNQLFTFLIDWSLKSVVTAAFGLALVLLLRRRSAATRNMVWRITLAAVILLPTAMLLTPTTGAPAVMEPIQAPVRSAIRGIAIPRPEHGIKIAPMASAMANAETEGTFEEQAAVFVYGVGLIAMVGFWLASYLRVRRIAGAASRMEGASGHHAVLIARRPELRVPITFGLFKPVILLPSEAEAWPDQRVRAAILHESAHIARNDWAWQTASHLIRSLQWFNPAIWLMHGALRTTSEAAADDEVLTGFGMGASTYASELLKVAAAANGQTYSATAMARRSGVAGRLRRIVATGVDRARPKRALVFGAGLAFSAAGVLVAAGTVAEAAGTQVAAPAMRMLGHNPIAAAIHSLTGTVRGSNFQAKLSHGGFVRMVAMTGPQDADGPIWRPDGKPANSADRALLASILRRDGSNQPGVRVINFYLQVAKLPMKPGDTENGIFRIKPSDGWQYQAGTNTSESDGRLQWDRWTAPASARTCDMDCAISYGKYMPVCSGKLGDGQFHSAVDRSQGDFTSLTFCLPGKFGDDEAKLECFDAEGNRVGGINEQIWGQDSADGEKFYFPYHNDELQRIVTYRFSRRPYEHVMLRGIVLPPNTITP